MHDINSILSILDKHGINYELVRHPAAYTGDEMDNFDIPHPEKIIKNLFLCDAKKKKFFLVVLPLHKKTNLDHLQKMLQTSRLSFASPQRLMKYLGVFPGSVSPLCMLNETAKEVHVIMSRELLDFGIIGVHPCDNTASVFITTKDLEYLFSERHINYFYADLS